MAKTNIQISLKAPAGLKVSRSTIASATKAAQAVLDSQLKFAAISKDLAAQGITLSPEQLAKAAGSKGGSAVASTGKRKRVVLSTADRKAAVSDLRGGATINSVAGKYGCSPQTIMGLKKAAGLVKAKKAKKKAAKRK
jgi:hypothetical protein